MQGQTVPMEETSLCAGFVVKISSSTGEISRIRVIQNVTIEDATLADAKPKLYLVGAYYSDVPDWQLTQTNMTRPSYWLRLNVTSLDPIPSPLVIRNAAEADAFVRCHKIKVGYTENGTNRVYLAGEWQSSAVIVGNSTRLVPSRYGAGVIMFDLDEVITFSSIQIHTNSTLIKAVSWKPDKDLFMPLVIASNSDLYVSTNLFHSFPFLTIAF